MTNVVFSPEALTHASRRDKQPSLGVIQEKGLPGRTRSIKFFSGDLHKENVRCAKVIAKQSASALHKECQPEAIPSKLLSVGTDCSGMEAPIQALRNLTPYFGHQHIFSCDNDIGVKKTTNANYNTRMI